jgi:hypothetical protein
MAVLRSRGSTIQAGEQAHSHSSLFCVEASLENPSLAGFKAVLKTLHEQTRLQLPQAPEVVCSTKLIDTAFRRDSATQSRAMYNGINSSPSFTSNESTFLPTEMPMEMAVINPMDTHLWRLTPRPAWLQERLLAMAQLRWVDLGPIEIAHSCEPDDIYRLARFKIGVQTFASNDDPAAPCLVAMIPDFCGRLDLIWRCTKPGCEECRSTRRLGKGRGWVKRLWPRVRAWMY